MVDRIGNAIRHNGRRLRDRCRIEASVGLDGGSVIVRAQGSLVRSAGIVRLVRAFPRTDPGVGIRDVGIRDVRIRGVGVRGGRGVDNRALVLAGSAFGVLTVQ